MQAELDQKTEELAHARGNLERQTREFSNMQHQMGAATSKEEGLHRRLQERD